MEIYAQEDFSTQSASPLENPRVSYPHENKGGTRGIVAPPRSRPQTFGGQAGIPGLVIKRAWPKEARLLRRSDFQRVYKTGKRFGSSLFTAFAVRAPRQEVSPQEQEAEAVPSRVGFTTPRALGKSVLRNRVRRRLREVVRMQYADLTPGWELIFNPRRALLDAETAAIQAEVARLFGMLSGVKTSGVRT
jgi:ribonuclease P protein component